MLLAVTGLMATLALPNHALPTLALTATATTARLLRRLARRRRLPPPTENGPTAAPPAAIHLEWAALTVHLAASGARAGRALLQNVSGHAHPGRVLFLLGPSGSGKTTLLSALAGRLRACKALALHGAITANGVSIEKAAHNPAFVTQDDLFFSQLTVRETLHTAAALRLPRDVTDAERARFVDALIRKLGLVEVTETAVGDEKTRGISGGEKKRLSLGCELISTPRLILCDEPTSGLDAFQADRVMRSLRALAEAGHTVVCSVHQPSSSIYKLCDDVLLLAGGRVAYAGTAAAAPAHFARIGFPMPEQCNPAERYLELVSVDFASSETVARSEARIAALVAAAEAKRGEGGVGVGEAFADGVAAPSVVAGRRLGPVGQIRVLLLRAWRQVKRDRKTNVSRLMSSVMSALLFGSIYWRIGLAQSTIQDRLGLLQVCTINAAMTALVKTLNVFPRESVLVNRERARGSYNVLQYLVSKLIAEMPVSAFFPLVFSLTVYPMVQLSGGVGRVLRFMGIITLESFTAASYGLTIGALMPSTEAALAVGPASFVLQIVFGGLYITDENVPGWASWIPRISLIKHAYEGLCVNEFRGIEFETQQPWDVKTGEQVLQRMTWGDSTVLKTCISQSRVLAFNYLMTYAILTLKKPRFEKLLPVVEEGVEDKPAVVAEVESNPATTTAHVEVKPVKTETASVPQQPLPAATDQQEEQTSSVRAQATA